MNERDRRALLDPAKLPPGGVWADLGAGEGVFTRVLAEVLGETALIWAVDRDARALRALTGVRTHVADFREVQGLPPLDGVLMANSLHYAGPLESALAKVTRLLKPGGVLLVVEYDTQSSGPWVPDPVPFARLVQAACVPEVGLSTPRLLARVRSSYHGHVYSALARRLEPRG